MKKNIVISLILLMIVLPSCSKREPSSDNVDNIIGEWQTYGTKIDNKIEPFEDEIRAKMFSQYAMVFNEDGTVILTSEGPEVSGTYSENSNYYIVTIPISESDPPAQMKCYIEEGFLIAEQILPDGYEGYDTGNPTAYKKAE